MKENLIDLAKDKLKELDIIYENSNPYKGFEISNEGKLVFTGDFNNLTKINELQEKRIILEDELALILNQLSKEYEEENSK